MNRNRFPILIALIAVLSLVIACGGSTKKEDKPVVEKGPAQEAYTGPPVDGDWIVSYFPSDPEGLNFISASGAYSSEVGRYVSDSVVDFDKNLNIIPRLAKSWDWSDDHMTLTFHFEENVKWHDGTPFTAHDIEYNYRKIMDPASGADNKIAQFEVIKDVKVIDDYTLEVYYKQLYAPALSSWAAAPWIIPKHIYEKEDWNTSEYNQSPMGTGPFKFVDWKRGSYIKLERNEDYWGQKPHAKVLLYKIKQEATVRLQSLMSGDIDMAAMKPIQWVKEASTPDFEARFDKIKYYQNQFYYIAWNMDGSNPFFRDKKVRQAMTYAFDREGINQKIYYGLWRVATGGISPLSWAYNTEIKPYPFDPEKAKELLTEAGWVDTDGDGIREKNGIPFHFTLLITTQNEVASQQANILKENLHKVGVEMDIQRLEWAVFLNRVKGSEFEAEMAAWANDIDPGSEYDLWHSSQWPDGINYGKFSNARVDEIVVQGRKEFDQEKRKALYWEEQEILHDEQPYLFTYYPASLVGIDKRFRGIETSPQGLRRFNPGFLDWWVPPNMQKYGSN